ncbi:MAG: FHA domain-containing protein [Gemmataceae bacterium]|nr:FHA domain-containing protein [Gemmataceae bacterium]
MGDPRLNSLHLDPARRQEYRRAREAMLSSRGNETLYAERARSLDSDPSPTAIRDAEGGDAKAQLDFWLTDRDYVYPLKTGLNTMGRSSDNDVIVEDLYVSRRHCGIMVHHDTVVMLHDTASKNGTFLNGAKIAGPTQLRAGDEIRICNKSYVFCSRLGPAPQANAAHTRTIAG